jgi:2-polyprenyl-6-hydroxyphenyl methylase/3-demethylubiquinone-9 3-methyltransferase
MDSKLSPKAWDYGTHTEFYDYYAERSLTPEARERFRAVRDTILRVDPNKISLRHCDVADIGCNAGTQSFLWAELGHQVFGVDINAPLLDLARERAQGLGHRIEFLLGSADSLPLPDGSIDICLVVELLEHVADWQSCLKEFARVLRPGGVLFMSTTNRLCPVQQEFNLPLYGWYPGPVKRLCERLAKTTHPRLANYAEYPAVNWFSYYGLRGVLTKAGFECMDRFDLIDTAHKRATISAVVHAIRKVPPLRWLAHVATPGTTILAIKRT